MTEMLESMDELQVAREERSKAVRDAGRLRAEVAALLLDVGMSNQHLDEARRVRDGLKSENRELRDRLEVLALATVDAVEEAFPEIERAAEEAELVEDAEVSEPMTQAERQMRIASRALRAALDDVLWISAQMDAPPSIASRAQGAAERLERTIELVRDA